MGKDAPEAPNPAALAAAQAEANRVDTYSPFGSAVYSGKNRNRLDINLSDAQDALLGGSQELQGQMLSRALGIVGGMADSPVDFSGMPGQVTGIELSSNPMENAVFQQAKGLLDPEFGDQRRMTEQMLANRGIPIGSEAYTREMDRLERAQNNALTQAAYQGVGAGADFAFRNAALQNQGRATGLGEQLTGRNQTLNELMAILGGTQIQPPQQQPATPVDVVGPAMAAHQSDLANWQNQQSMLGGLFSLGGTLGGAAIFCWAARAVYGEADGRWLRFRRWLLEQAPGPLLRLYREHGPALAEKVKSDAFVRLRVKSLMDDLLETVDA